jgi:hypothetical protein
MASRRTNTLSYALVLSSIALLAEGQFDGFGLTFSTEKPTAAPTLTVITERVWDTNIKAPTTIGSVPPPTYEPIIWPTLAPISDENGDTGSVDSSLGQQEVNEDEPVEKSV